jgi:hypothetical protein
MLARYDDAGSLTFETKRKVELGPCGLAKQRRPGVPCSSSSSFRLGHKAAVGTWKVGGAFARTFPGCLTDQSFPYLPIDDFSHASHYMEDNVLPPNIASISSTSRYRT